MITRLWVSLSLVWAVVIFAASSPSEWPHKETGTIVQLLVLIFAPLISGLGLKLLARYVITGSPHR
jgi:hypothetical protein